MICRIRPIRRQPIDPEVSDAFMELGDYASFTPVFDATGQPSLSLPLQESTAGLPWG